MEGKAVQAQCRKRSACVWTRAMDALTIPIQPLLFPTFNEPVYRVYQISECQAKYVQADFSPPWSTGFTHSF